MTSLKILEAWYRKACDGIWEHSYGVTIETLDNPGWRVQIDLEGTSYQEVGPCEFDVQRSDADWMRCRIEGKKFEGVGDPEKLEQILQVFAEWLDLAE